MGLDVLEHFYDPEPTEVTNHCHHVETNPTSSVTQGSVQVCPAAVLGSVCLNEEGSKYLAVWNLEHQCLAVCRLSVYFKTAPVAQSDSVNLSRDTHSVTAIKKLNGYYLVLTCRRRHIAGFLFLIMKTSKLPLMQCMCSLCVITGMFPTRKNLWVTPSWSASPKERNRDRGATEILLPSKNAWMRSFRDPVRKSCRCKSFESLNACRSFCS